MLVRITQTPASALGGLILRATVAGFSEARVMDALTAASGLKHRDLDALLRREVVPTADLGPALAGMARVLGADPREVVYRSEMQRSMDGDADEEHPRHRFVMSTAAEDRAWDIVEQDWSLDDFNRNPVCPFGHRYWEPVVGIWHDVGVVDGALRGDLEPVPLESYPLSQTVAEQLRRGVLRTVSVGFMPRASVPRVSLPKEDPRWGERGYLYLGNSLHECSVVPVPMNAEAEAQRDAPPAPRPADHWLFAK